jgi:hypothetical protein
MCLCLLVDVRIVVPPKSLKSFFAEALVAPWNITMHPVVRGVEVSCCLVPLAFLLPSDAWFYEAE